MVHTPKPLVVVPPMVIRRRVVRVRKQARRTMLSNLDNPLRDLTDEEFDALVAEMRLPAIVEEEYSTYEYDVVDPFSSTMSTLDGFEDGFASAEAREAFLRETEVPPSWQYAEVYDSEESAFSDTFYNREYEEEQEYVNDAGRGFIHDDDIVGFGSRGNVQIDIGGESVSTNVASRVASQLSHNRGKMTQATASSFRPPPQNGGFRQTEGTSGPPPPPPPIRSIQPYKAKPENSAGFEDSTSSDETELLNEEDMSILAESMLEDADGSLDYENDEYDSMGEEDWAILQTATLAMRDEDISPWKVHGDELDEFTVEPDDFTDGEKIEFMDSEKENGTIQEFFNLTVEEDSLSEEKEMNLGESAGWKDATGIPPPPPPPPPPDKTSFEYLGRPIFKPVQIRPPPPPPPLPSDGNAFGLKGRQAVTAAVRPKQWSSSIGSRNVVGSAPTTDKQTLRSDEKRST